MHLLRRGRTHRWPALVILSQTAILIAGCASPGPPRPPSLQLPQLVSDLTVARSGDTVEVRFTVPARTTDGQRIRTPTVSGSLCRQVAAKDPCVPVDMAATGAPLRVPAENASQPVLWTDPLPSTLAAGPPTLIRYRVELRNAAGRSAGWSDAAYAAAGASPPAVGGLVAEGTRVGVALRWAPETGGGEVLFERTALAPETLVAPKTGSLKGAGRAAGASKKAAAGIVWLEAAPGDGHATATIDGGAEEGIPYRYVAVRRAMVQIGGRRLELRSAPSGAVTFTWHDVYPPRPPEGLSALGYAVPAVGPSAEQNRSEKAAGYAVDLVWQPVDDPRLAGYLVYREAVPGPGGQPGKRLRLTPEPVTAPGFHDSTAQPNQRYRYSVSAIDPKGNESGTADAIAEPAAP